jgi:hypothetical protein
MPLRESPARTPALLAALRANARKSHGPRTARGKARSSLNALKHGRYAFRLRRKLLEGGDRQAEALYAQIEERVAEAFCSGWIPAPPPARRTGSAGVTVLKQSAEVLVSAEDQRQPPADESGLVFCRPLSAPKAAAIPQNNPGICHGINGLSREESPTHQDSGARRPSADWSGLLGPAAAAPRLERLLEALWQGVREGCGSSGRHRVPAARGGRGRRLASGR